MYFTASARARGELKSIDEGGPEMAIKMGGTLTPPTLDLKHSLLNSHSDHSRIHHLRCGPR